MNFQNQTDYLKQFNNEDILSGVTVPAPLVKDTLKSQIMFRCGLLEPVYSEPYIMQTAISQFFKREQWNITHLVNIILAEYSPIENTDKYTEHTIDRSGSRTVTEAGTDTLSGKDQRDISHSGTDTRDIVHGGTDQRDESHTGTDERDIGHTGTDTTTDTVSAFNSSTYQPDRQSELLHGETIDDDLTHGETIDDDITYGHTIDDDTTWGHKIDDDVTYGKTSTKNSSVTDESSGKDTYTEHTHGNIGVTTNQQMIEQELELLRHFDIYDWIAAKLENELFIQVY